jgi:GTPase KRas protein
MKLIVMGVGGVGKSAITNRLVFGRWIEKYDPTVEESFSTAIEVDGKAQQIDILDTAGQDAFTSLRETFMHKGDGFILVYSITDDQTLEELRSIREQILRVHRNKQVPLIVIGNKLDLAKQERAVSVEEGKALAEEFGAQFMEVTAKDNVKVKDAFVSIVRAVKSSQDKVEASQPPAGVFGLEIENVDDKSEASGLSPRWPKNEVKPPVVAQSANSQKVVDKSGCGCILS